MYDSSPEDLPEDENIRRHFQALQRRAARTVARRQAANMDGAPPAYGSVALPSAGLSLQSDQSRAASPFGQHVLSGGRSTAPFGHIPRRYPRPAPFDQLASYCLSPFIPAGRLDSILYSNRALLYQTRYGPPQPPTTHAISGTGSMFLDLPAELRNTIYEKVLTIEPNDGGTVKIVSWPRIRQSPSSVSRRWDKKGARWILAAREASYSVRSIAYTSRQVRGECCGLFYTLNHLEVSVKSGCSSPLWSFIQSNMRDGVNEMTSLTVILQDWSCVYNMMRALTRLRGLRCLKIIYKGHYDRMVDIVKDDYLEEVQLLNQRGVLSVALEWPGCPLGPESALVKELRVHAMQG